MKTETIPTDDFARLLAELHQTQDALNSEANKLTMGLMRINQFLVSDEDHGKSVEERP